EAPVGEWRALASREGWRAMRLDTISSARPADFDALRGVVLQDWTDATMAEQRTAAVRALGKKYKVVIEDAAK
ncbi:MAG: peptidyl-prolyl cis-trans isomerase, partial [Burkholderiaceae bacterium]|nr:peptidyl-prolyl cis-trans isomerase [Burkholderiaceae bacterium]